MYFSLLTYVTFFLLYIETNGKPMTTQEADFDGGTIIAYVDDPNVVEASGLAASRQHPGVLYTFNDSGGASRIFAIAISDGSTLATLDIADATNCDWEDIAVGVGPGGTWHIYIGDIGGNSARVCNTIYVVEEPVVLEDAVLTPSRAIQFTWNEPDCETLLVDPNGFLYLISKVDSGDFPNLYLIPQEWPYPETIQDDTVPAIGGTKVWLLSEDRGPVAGDISPDGSELVLKNYDAIIHWEITEGETLPEALQKLPSIVPYEPEPQGESIAWDISGNGFYTLSEGANQPLWYHNRTSI